MSKEHTIDRMAYTLNKLKLIDIESYYAIYYWSYML